MANSDFSPLPLFELMHTAGPILNELQYEIRRSVDYFCRKFPCEKIEQVFLSGGTAMMADFPEWLEEDSQNTLHEFTYLRC